MSKVNKKQRSNVDIKQIAKELPRPIKEEDINPVVQNEPHFHMPIRVKSECELLNNTTTDGIATPIVTRKTTVKVSHSKVPQVPQEPNAAEQSNKLNNKIPDTSMIEAPSSSSNTQEKCEIPAAQVLKVKSEISDNLSDEFFDELMEDVEGIVKAATLNNHKTADPSKISSQSEGVSNNDGKATASKEELQELRRKLLLELEKTDSDNKIIKQEPIAYTSPTKTKKKKEKSKNKDKKSRKRERSASESLSPKHQQRDSSPPTNKTSPWQRRSEQHEFHQSKSPTKSRSKEVSPLNSPPMFQRRDYSPKSNLSQHQENLTFEDNAKIDVLPSTSNFKRIKLEMMPRCSKPKVDEQPPLLKSTPKTKREEALMRVAAALAEFKKFAHAKDEYRMESTLIYTATIRKLPTSNSFITQQIYDNRSPLHTIQNVCYEFNSNANPVNLHDWGLKSMPQAAVKVAKILGIDAYTLYRKLLVTKLPSVVKKIKSDEKVNEETIDQPRSVLYTNAMTQTDTALYANRHKTFDMGVQTIPRSYSTIASQTTNTGDNGITVIPQLPLNSMMQHLNEYQILALNDFAELLREPGNLANDIYQLRQRLLDIYKTASDRPTSVQQLPMHNQASHMHNRSHTETYVQQQHIPTIRAHTRLLDPRLRNENIYNNFHHQQ